ncbi:MAG: efflux RND transporter periplasmic adaptor subunit [Acidobacteria bacterium]|nr:efflux RND transporter periplasmic adaptor subunit [Acidobacteriota bacterium]
MYRDHFGERTKLPVFGRVELLALVVVLALLSSACGGGATKEATAQKPGEAQTEKSGVDKEKEGEEKEVKLSPEALAAAKLEFAVVEQRAAGGSLRVTGTVEANQEQTQQATPLVSGRIEQVNVKLGDRVSRGQALAVISSPQIAQMHGKLHEAETKLGLAERELERVLKAENRAAVLSAKARLDEAESSLKRTQKLIELGAGAGKDLVAAETAYRTAKADYDFQSNIVLNKEIQEARADVETARVDVAHIRDEMSSLGAPVGREEHSEHGDDHQRNTSLIVLRAPVAGTVTERMVNPGAGIEAGKPLFTIANISTVWVIANVPEAMVNRLRLGVPAAIRGAALGADARAGRVTYIDPRLNEETRTAQVRLELANPGERLKTGMFVEVEFQTPDTGSTDAGRTELFVPEAAVQRLGEESLVFILDEKEPGHFKAREVELGGAIGGYHRVISGLQAGDRVVTQGSFTLKTQLMKGELGEHGH